MPIHFVQVDSAWQVVADDAYRRPKSQNIWMSVKKRYTLALEGAAKRYKLNRQSD